MDLTKSTLKATSFSMGLFALAGCLLMGCGGGAGSTSGGGSGGGTTPTTAKTPAISSTAAQNGASIVTISSTESAAKIYYTIDGTTPTTSSIQYLAPFLVAANETLNAISVVSGETNSNVATQTFAPNIASGTLVWSDEFTQQNNSQQPNATTWAYDTGAGGWGNSELENYCAWNSNTAPCNSSSPNAFVDANGYLNIVAQQPTSGTYTSARMKTEGLFSFQYGRVEARIQIPEAQGLWPAFWMLGNNITTVNWPACGELDVMEHIDGSNPSNKGYDWVQSSIHGTNLNGGVPYTTTGFNAAAWHTYGMIWTKGQIKFYVDSPSNVYETFNSSTQAGTWPFDNGPQFLLLNLAVGGSWPGNPNGTTNFPATMLVDYVRIYTN